MARRWSRVLVLGTTLFALVALLAYLYSAPGAPQKLTVAITTSVKDTGLMDALVAGFKQWGKVRTGVDLEVQFVAVGTGAAVRMAERGDVDFIVVHAPPLERQEIARNILTCRVPFAYNFFVLVGPSDDPAAVSGRDLSDAFRQIYHGGRESRIAFISRGDDSGTHQKEQRLWSEARINHTELVARFSGRWYLESGKGMGDTLLLANEKKAYTLTDIGTWLAFRQRLPALRALVAKSLGGINVYSVLIPNPDTFPRVKFELARLFEEYVTGVDGQSVVAAFGRAQYGEPVFTPFSNLNLGAPGADAVAKWIAENAVFDSPCPPVQRQVTPAAVGPTLLFGSAQMTELLATTSRSVYVALSATGLAAVWSIPAAIGLAFGSFRYREAIEIGFEALMGVPTVILGLLFYLLLARSGPFGGTGILFTPEAIVIASSVLVTPILVSLVTATLKSGGREVREAALTVGASPFRAGLEVLHELRLPLAVVVLVAFTRAIGELGVAFMVGGDIRFSTRVLSTAIAFETARGNWELALLFSGVLLLIVLAMSVVSVRLVKHGFRRRAA